MKHKPQATEPKSGNYAASVKGKTGIRRIVNAAGYSFDGFKAAWSESAFRQLVWLNGTLIILACWLDFGPATKMLLIMASMISLMVELINTGIEAAVDHTSLDKHELAKRAKDVGSAAQFLGLTLLALMWLMALWRDYGLNLF